MRSNFFAFIRKDRKHGEDRTVVRMPVLGDRGYVPRRTYLEKSDFKKFFVIAWCPGCVQLQDSMGRRSDHTDVCRNRIADELKATDEDLERVAGAESSRTQWVVERHPEGQDAMDVEEGAGNTQLGTPDPSSTTTCDKNRRIPLEELTVLESPDLQSGWGISQSRKTEKRCRSFKLLLEKGPELTKASTQQEWC